MPRPEGHQPVLVAEVVSGLAAAPGKHFIDGTAGNGGHARALLSATAPDGQVLAIDWDTNAVARLKLVASDPALGKRMLVAHGNFTTMEEVAKTLGFTPSGGCLLDLGLSSLQLDAPEAGFGFDAERLDFRFDATTEVPTAADLVNRLPVGKLADVLKSYGEEPLARPIASAIVRLREREPFRQGAQLAAVVAGVYRHHYGKPSRRHPATRTFQALRIAVNHELENLQTALRSSLTLLPPGARMAVISYHSLEDRIVKQFFREYARPCRCPSDAPRCTCGGPYLAAVTRKPVIPGDAEVAANPRSRSAKLRIAQRLFNQIPLIKQT
ncbi:MAG: 16S rRNA (cytosine(1402)-N(4))-methyltransferase RsmH [bacterium]|nr:16S rRNA (cytosine(1402)-N(4))-methyltransferase RsmH [bacterium]